MFLFLLKIFSPDTLLTGLRDSAMWYIRTYQGQVENFWREEMQTVMFIYRRMEDQINGMFDGS